MAKAAHARETNLLLVLAAILFVLRLWNTGSMPFLYDEPLVQRHIDRHMSQGTLPDVGLMGSRGVRYGPTSQWGFLPVRLFTADLSPVAMLNACYFALSFALLFFALRRSLSDRAAAWAVLLAASSPYLFMYSRVLWETTFIILTSAMLLYAASLFRTPAIRRVWLWLWTGAGMALAFNTHAFMLPVLGVTVLAAAHAARKDGRVRVVHVLAGLLAFLFVLAPYFTGVWRTMLSRSGLEWTGFPVMQTVVGTFYGAVRYLSIGGMQYFFDMRPDEFAARIWQSGFNPGITAPVPFTILSALATGTACMFLWRLVRRREVPAAVTFGLSCFAAVAAFYLVARPELGHPHYFAHLWWLPFMLVAAGLDSLKGRWHAVFKIVAAWLVVLNVAFVASAQAFIERNAGVRGPHYGTSRIVLQAAVSAVCEEAAARRETTVYVDVTAAGVMPVALWYFKEHLPECRGASVIFMDGEPPEGAFGMVIEYAPGPDTSAMLRVRPR